MAHKVLFIGAGASFGARENQSKRPPLGNKLCDWLRLVASDYLGRIYHCHSVIEDGKKILAKYTDEQNYEVLISKLNKEERLAMQRLLQVSFAPLIKYGIDIGFSDQQDGYDELIQKLKINSNDWCVISLNYDLLLEDALRRCGIEYIYPQFPYEFNDDQKNRTELKIYKPHGSINFFAHPDPNTGEDDDPLPYIFDFNGDDAVPNFAIVFAAPHGTENILSNTCFCGNIHPVMANYAQNKTMDANPRRLIEVRNLALEECKSAQEVHIVGVRPIFDPTDDPIVSQIFTTEFKRMVFVTKSIDEANLLKQKCKSVEIFNNGLLNYCSTL